MANAPTRLLPMELVQTLTKILPLLSSDQSGEVSAAVAACNRALTAHGRDWHDVVGVLTQVGNLPSLYTPPQAYRDRSAQNEASSGYVLVDSGLVRIKINALFASGVKLNGRAAEFIAQMFQKAMNHDKVHMSPRQKQWFEDIVNQRHKYETPDHGFGEVPL